MWIIDHTVQLGDRKCLVIVGLRQSAWEQAESRILSHKDVELIDLQPVTQSNGKVVYQQLKAAATKTGVPRAIISDKGSDLHCGIDLFRHRYRDTVWMYDIKHKTACLLKQILLKDRSWTEFRQEGLHQEAVTELDACMPKPATRPAQQMRRQLLEFVREQGQQAREGERLLGSSEVLESVIGKFKHLAGERGQHGMAGMALSIGAFVGPQAIGTMQTALEETTTSDVWGWCR